jgi:hypothetical protein
MQEASSCSFVTVLQRLWLYRKMTMLGLLSVTGSILGLVFLIFVGVRAFRTRRDRAGSGFGVVDEIYNPSAFNTAIVREQEAVQPAPAPLPGDKRPERK